MSLKFNIPAPIPATFPKGPFNLNNINILNLSIANPYKLGDLGQDDRDPIQHYSAIGTPVFSFIEFEGGDYTGFDNKTYHFDTVTIDTVIMAAHQAKNIVKTNVQGSDGEVKEYIGMSDWDITINVVISSNKNMVYPYDAVAALWRMLKAPISIKVTSQWLNQFDIYNLVIYDFEPVQIEGGYSQQGITIRAYSDMPADLDQILIPTA